MQFYISGVIVPVTTVIVMLGVLLNHVNLNHGVWDLRSEFDARFEHQNSEFNARFDRLHEALLRVVGVLDARFTQIARQLNTR